MKIALTNLICFGILFIDTSLHKHLTSHLRRNSLKSLTHSIQKLTQINSSGDRFSQVEWLDVRQRYLCTLLILLEHELELILAEK